ncbi:hypothetical protein C943_02722 [Mariniradius saccharolyticus AK6]|uniref:Uncharacterized protein n=1 Tax=Mariniradius saccharolyticus AK6 TaxID=1239962 RepID=M7X7I3_9BACT|nr:hypothetical protein C943_02722 [Mariniradius saccharolyticus AK6]
MQSLGSGIFRKLPEEAFTEIVGELEFIHKVSIAKRARSILNSFMDI